MQQNSFVVAHFYACDFSLDTDGNRLVTYGAPAIHRAPVLRAGYPNLFLPLHPMSLTSHPAAATLPCRPDRLEEFLSEPTSAVVATVGQLTGTVLVLGAGGKMGLHLSLMLRKAAQRAGTSLRIVAVSRFQALRDRQSF